MGLVRITGEFFCAGVEHKNGFVVRAAPILKYMIGWNGSKVAAYCNKRGWKWEKV
jgi:hypothetical protein